jgi:CBS domain-containing protein
MCLSQIKPNPPLETKVCSGASAARPKESIVSASLSNVGVLCTRSVVFAYSAMSVAEAARLMSERRVGCLVVVDEAVPEQRTVVGMLTDRDIVTAVVARDLDPHGLSVAEIMSRNPACAREDDVLLDVLALMRRRGVRRLPVTGVRGELIGLVALDDVLEIVAEELQALSQAVGANVRHAPALQP